MRDLLLVVWIATIGADRIDLLGGSGPFVLTPFLVLTPIILAMTIARWGIGHRKLHIPRDAAAFVLVATALTSLVVISVMFSADIEVSAKRAALLFVQLYGASFVALLLVNHPRAENILVRGAYWGLVLVVLFNIAQVWFWVTEGATSVLWGIMDLTPQVYGSWVPRLSGAVIDQNRGGLLILIYLFLLWRFAKPTRLRSVFISVGILALLTTLSRSAILGGLTTASVLFLTSVPARISKSQIFGFAFVSSMVVVLLMMLPRQADRVATFAEPLAGRFSLSEGSSSMHLQLIDRGLEVSTASFRNAAIGIGFGNSFQVLESFYPDSEYANFHSLYLTLLVEAGVFALAFGLILILFPIMRGGPFLPIVVGMFFFNLFYQSATDPAFWLMIALAWFTAESRMPRFAPHQESRDLTLHESRSLNSCAV